MRDHEADDRESIESAVPEPALADLEEDIRALLADPRSGGNAKRIIAEVVTESDYPEDHPGHIPEDERAAVALEMYERIVEGAR